MGISITRAKGQLNRTQPTDDAVICMVISGAAVVGKIGLSEPKQIFTSEALTDLGITEANNPVAFRDITDYYGKAGEGAELNFMLIGNATTLEDICDPTGTITKTLLDFTEGRGVVLLVNKDFPEDYVPVITTGFDADVLAAATKLNALAIQYQDANVPFVAVLPAFGFSKDTIATMPERSTMQNDNVALSMACEKEDGHISMGLLAGCIANAQVSQNIGRVLFGAVCNTGFFPDKTPAADLKNSYAALDSKGIIYFMKIAGKSGVYFNDDPCFTATTSDYSSISWNRVINKAHRIAYDILVEKLRDDVDLDPSTGKVESSLLSDWESDVENAIRTSMIAVPVGKQTEISGIKCTIDPNSDINNDQLSASIDIVRKGQVKTIAVRIGFVQSL